jgi:hypothetical protein
MHSISNSKGYCCVWAQELIRGDTPYIKQIKIEKYRARNNETSSSTYK